MRTNLLYLCLAIAGPLSGRAAQLDDYNVVWNSPSTNHHGSMPLGNGEIALNAWLTGGGDLQFYIAKIDAWEDNARLVKVGKVRLHLAPNPIAAGTAFRQELNLREGTIEISIGGRAQTRLRLWVDANHPVINVTCESDSPLESTAVIELWRTNRQELAMPDVSDVMLNRAKPDKKEGPTIIEPDTLLAGARERIGWYHHNGKSLGPKLLAEVQGLTGFQMADPLFHRTFGAVICATRGERVDDSRLRSPRGTNHQFRIHVLTQHPATPEQWLVAMDKAIGAAERQSFAKRRAAHEQWWNEFWNRSWIRATGDADAALVSQKYHLQRFITACAGRGAYPIKFNGSLFTVAPGPTEADPDYRRWGPGYWWQNTRLPYISLCASGDFDLQAPLFRMYGEDLLPICKYRTQRYLGTGGAFYPECLMFWGPTFSVVYGWTPFEQRADKLQVHPGHKWEWVCGPELAWMMLDNYEHTMNRVFLRETVLPFAREILTFFDQHYPTNAGGKLVMHPSQALETWLICTNPMPELAGCVALTERLLALPAELSSPADREFWQRFQSKLPPIPLRDLKGRKALAPAEVFAKKANVENPELYSVFPFRLFAFNRPNVEWALTALDNRGERGHSGWRQDDIFMAYLGRTADARKGLVSRARSYDKGERFPAFWGPNYDWTPDQDHGGVLMKTFQSMLMQTDGKQIFLLPSWPKEWNVEFKLHAPQRTVVEGVYRDGKMQTLRVTPESRRADVQVICGAGEAR